jgi:hypothetical protein
VKCIGYGPREDVCEAEATTPAGIWCPVCELERRETISRQFEKIGASFAAALADSEPPE